MLYIVYLNYFTKELPMVKEHRGNSLKRKYKLLIIMWKYIKTY